MLTRNSAPIAVWRALTDPVVERILSFGDLPRGWHYGNGRPASRVAIDFALRIIRALKDAGAETVEAFPDIEGGILISGYYNDETVDILCQADGTIDLSHEKGDNEIADESAVSFSDSLLYIRRLSWPPQRLSAFSIRNISVIKSGDLNLSPTAPLLTASLSSTRTALLPHPEMNALIFGDSTIRELPESRQFFSGSQLVRYQEQ